MVYARRLVIPITIGLIVASIIFLVTIDRPLPFVGLPYTRLPLLLVAVIILVAAITMTVAQQRDLIAERRALEQENEVLAARLKASEAQQPARQQGRSEPGITPLGIHRHRLLRVIQRLVGSLTFDELMESLPQALSAVVSHTSFGLYMIDREQGILRPILFTGTEWLGDISTWSIPLDQGIAGSVVAHGRNELVNNAQLDPRAVYPEGVNVVCEHLIALPLRTQDEIFGVSLLTRTSDPPFSADEFELVELFISYVSLVLTNAHLFEQVRRSEGRLRAAMDGSMDSVLLLESIRDSQGQIEDFLIVDANPTGVQLIGKPYSEIVGQRLCQLLPLNRTAGFFEKYVQVVETRQPFDEEFTIEGEKETIWRYHQIVPLGDGIAITSRNITERKQAEVALMQLATSDTLTGVLNRRQLFVLANAELTLAQRYGRSLAVVMLDIDNFKELNDTYGHLFGDRVLQHVAEQCDAGIRTGDLLGRYGGEEFLVFLLEASLDDALQIAERLRQRIEQHVIRVSERNLSVTASFGVTTYLGDPNRPDLDSSIEDLIEAADQALYAAKHAGKNQVVWISAEGQVNTYTMVG